MSDWFHIDSFGDWQSVSGGSEGLEGYEGRNDSFDDFDLWQDDSPERSFQHGYDPWAFESERSTEGYLQDDRYYQTENIPSGNQESVDDSDEPENYAQLQQQQDVGSDHAQNDPSDNDEYDGESDEPEDYLQEVDSFDQSDYSLGDDNWEYDGESDEPEDFEQLHQQQGDDDDEYAEVYTDGACSSNGQSNAKAGWGVFWGEGNPSNSSGPVHGEQTNNRAELLGAINAVDQARAQGIERLRIKTDSDLMVRSQNEWKDKWKQNGWRAATGAPVKNQDLLMELDQKMEALDLMSGIPPGHGPPGQMPQQRGYPQNPTENWGAYGGPGGPQQQGQPPQQHQQHPQQQQHHQQQQQYYQSMGGKPQMGSGMYPPQMSGNTQQMSQMGGQPQMQGYQSGMPPSQPVMPPQGMSLQQQQQHHMMNQSRHAGGAYSGGQYQQPGPGPMPQHPQQVPPQMAPQQSQQPQQHPAYYQQQQQQMQQQQPQHPHQPPAQQQPHHPTQPIIQHPHHPQGPQVTYQGPAVVSAPQMPAPVQPEQPLQRPKLNPPPYPAELLDNLAECPVPMLCTIGRELVQDLSMRSAHLCTRARDFSEKARNFQQQFVLEIEVHLDYCQLILQKLLEIRNRIENKSPGIQLDADDFISRMAAPGSPEISEELEDKIREYDEKRAQLISVTADLKMLDWKAAACETTAVKRDRNDKLSTY